MMKLSIVKTVQFQILSALAIIAFWAALQAAYKLADAVSDLNLHNQTTKINRAGALIATASKHLAFERGRMNIALRAAEPINDEDRDFIIKNRAASENALEAAIQLIDTAWNSESSKDKLDATGKLKAQRDTIRQLRQRADAATSQQLVERADLTLPDRWFPAMTSLLEANRNLLSIINQELSGASPNIAALSILRSAALDFRFALGSEVSQILAILQSEGLFTPERLRETAIIKGMTDLVYAELLRQARLSRDTPILDASFQALALYREEYSLIRERIWEAIEIGQPIKISPTQYRTRAIEAMDAAFSVVEIANKSIEQNFESQIAELRKALIFASATLLGTIILVAVIIVNVRNRLLIPIERVTQGMRRFLRNKNASQSSVVNNTEVDHLVSVAEALEEELLLSLSEEKRLSTIISNQAAGIAAQAQFQKAVLENIADAVITINERGLISSFNPSAERMFGYKAIEVLGQNVSILAAEPDRSKHDTYLKSYLETGIQKIIGKAGREVIGVRKDGVRVPMELLVTRADIDGKIMFVGTIRDISERTELRNSLKERSRFLEEMSKIQELHLQGHSKDAILQKLAELALTLTQAQLGFLAEVRKDAEGRPQIISRSQAAAGSALKTLTEHGENEDLRDRLAEKIALQVIETHAPAVLPFRRTELDGSEAPKDKYAPLIVGIPLKMSDAVVGVIGVVIEQEWATEPAILALGPMVKTCESILQSFRIDASRRELLEKLEESQKQTQVLFEESPIGLVLYRLDGVIVSANRAFCRMHGHDGNEIMGQNIAEFTSRKYERQESIQREALLRTGHFGPYEKECRHKDGSYFPVRAYGRLIQRGDEKWVWSTIENLAEERRAQDVERSLANAQRIARLGNWDWNIQTNALWWSDEIYRIFGLEPQKFKATYSEFLSRVHPDDRALVEAGVKAALSGEKEYNLYHRILRPDGAVRIVHEQGELQIDDEGRALRMTGTVQDVTERRTTEEEMRKSEQKLRLLIESLPAAISYISSDLVVQFTNKTALEWIGKSEREVVGKSYIDAALLGATYLDRIRPYVNDVLGGALARFEAELVVSQSGNHKSRVLEVTYVPDSDEQGRVRGFISLATDIGDRLAIESQLRQAQKMEAVGQLTGGIAHDFNNFLGVIIGNLDLLLMHISDDSEKRKYVERAIEAAEKGGALTKTLLAFSRKQALQPTTVDANSVVSDLVSMLHASLGEAISLSLSLDPSLWACRVDPAQLESAVLNLCVNARDAMPNGGLLSISTSNLAVDRTLLGLDVDLPDGDYVYVAITDNGVGMSKETVKRVFEPFFTTKEVGKGSGLGLSMVYGFAQQSKGAVRIYSEIGKGTSVFLYLPRSHEGNETSDVRLTKNTNGAGQKILVVEDNDEIRKFVKEALEVSGYRMLEAKDFVQAEQAILETNDIDLLLTDIILGPGKSGFDLAAQAKEMAPDIRVVFMSGYASISGLKDGEVPANLRLIMKPFRTGELTQVINQALSAPL